MRRAGIAVLAAVLGAMALVADAGAEVAVSARIEPSVVAVGSEATLVVTVRGKFRRTGQPELPDLDGFQVYQAGTSQSFSLVNGQRSVSLVFTYILVAQNVGRYTIEPIRFETDGKIYTANEVTVEVVKSSPKLPPPSAPADDSFDSANAPIFIRATVDRDTVYVNQQVTWKLGFYTDGRIDLLRSPEYSPPKSEGFWVEDLPPQKNYYQDINGKQYLVNEIFRGFFPSAPGEYTIGAAEIEIVLDDFAGRSVFDDFFNLRRRGLGFGKSRKLSTDPIVITVLPLPQGGKPASFSGLVGRGLQMSLRADKTAVRAGEPVSVTLEITGEGNFKTMAAPEIPEMQGFKMYESGSTSELFNSEYVVTGHKITNFVLIPKDAGEAVIPSLEVSYFDPYEGRYNTIRSQQLRLQVSPGAQGEGGPQVVFTGSGQDIEVLGRDIHYIHDVPGDVIVAGTPFYARGAFAALNSLPLLAVALALVVERRRRRWQDDLPKARALRAQRAADKRLEEARRAARDDRPDDVYARVSAALRGYLADKMNMSAAGLTAPEIDAFLEGAGLQEDLPRRLHSLLAACDGARYSAAAVTREAAERTLKEARELLRDLEAGLPV